MKDPTKREKIKAAASPSIRHQFPPPLRHLGSLIFMGVLVCLVTAAGPARPVKANRALPTDLSYSTETTWLLPGLPDLDAASGYIPHNFSHGEAIFQTGNEVIHGFRPGKVYPEMYVRDIAWGMETAQYYYPDKYLREPIEAYLRRQYTASSVSLDGDFGVVAGAGAIGGIITPQGRSNKQTITTDEETSLIHAAYLYYNMTYNVNWLQSDISGRSVIERLNQSAAWLYTYRLDRQLQLLWRGHTTDWGDVKFEDGPGYTDYNPAQDHLTASIYDQALAYLALLELAEMNAAVGDTARADEWQNKAEALKAQTNELLWQPKRGYYLTHAHVTPLAHDFDESVMVSISNALAVYSGLTDFQQNKAIFQNLERARLAAGAKKPGLSLYPYYPNQWPNLFFEYSGMGYGNYQNGGVWDWWGGVQIKAEFQTGFAKMALTHLLQVANDWQKHPGNIIEWHSTTDPRHEGSHYYSAAAGTMGSAIIEGFFGVELTGHGLLLQPRLGLNDGFIRVYQPATDRYAAYSYDWDQDITRLSYGTNAQGSVSIRILKLRSEQIVNVTIDGQPVEYHTETVGHDTYTVITAPSGQHHLELVKGRPSAQISAPENGAAASAEEVISTDFRPPTPNNAPNRVLPPHTEIDNQAQEGGLASLAGSSTSPRVIHTPSPIITNTRKNREAWLSFIQIMSTALVVLTCLAVVGLVAMKRTGGLQARRSTGPQHRPPSQPNNQVIEFGTGGGDHRSTR